MQGLMLCQRPITKLKAPVCMARPFLPTSCTQQLEGVGLNVSIVLVCALLVLPLLVRDCSWAFALAQAALQPD